MAPNPQRDESRRIAAKGSFSPRNGKVHGVSPESSNGMTAMASLGRKGRSLAYREMKSSPPPMVTGLASEPYPCQQKHVPTTPSVTLSPYNNTKQRTSTSGAVTAWESAATAQPSSTRSDLALSKRNTGSWFLMFRLDIQKYLDSQVFRPLSLQQCLDMTRTCLTAKALVEKKAKDALKLSGSKVKSDIKYLPESLEAFVYNDFDRRYGLRKLAVENAATLIAAMDTYATERHEIAVFQAVFNGDVNEDFLDVLDDLKCSIQNLLMTRIQLQRPNLVSSEYASIYQRRIAGALHPNEWVEIWSTSTTGWTAPK